MSIVEKYGKQTTSNFDLMKIAKNENIKPFYVVMRDEVKTLRDSKDKLFYAVTNIHTSKENGIHWSCFAKTPKGNFFFDSYGLPPTQEVKDLLKHATHNTFEIQERGTTHCGQLCMQVLKDISEGLSFTDSVLSLKNLV